MKQGSNPKCLRLRKGSYPNLDNAILKWLVIVSGRDVTVSALVLKTRAKEFSEQMNVKNFQAYDGWLGHCNKRHNVSFKAVSGEGNACTNEMTVP